MTLLFLTVPSLSLHAKAKKQSSAAPTAVELTSLVLSGQYDEALKNLQGSKGKKLKGKYQNRLHFMAGFLNYQAGRHQEAAKIFEKLRNQYPVLQNYIDFYLALSLRESGEAKKAVKILNELKGKETSPHLKGKIDRELALAYCKAGDRGMAITMLNGLIQTEPSDIKSYHLRFDRSQCLVDLGYPDEALITLRSLYLRYPEGDLSEKIRQLLGQIGRSSTISVQDHLARAEQLMKSKRPKLAAEDFEVVVAQYGRQAPPDLKKKLADAYFKSRQYPKAATAYEDLQNSYPGSFTAKDELRLAQAYARSDQFSKAIAAYEKMLIGTKTGQDPGLEYKIAFLHMDKGDLKKSNVLFEEILKKYPKHRSRDKIYWFLAWNNYLLKNYDMAQAHFSTLETEKPRSRYAQRVPYWRARILEKQGQSSAARSAYQSIVERDPFSYYGFASLKRLENNNDLKTPPKNSWAASLPRLSIPPPFSISNLEPGGKKSLARVKELLVVGLWEDFLGELNVLTAQEGVSMDLQDLKSEIDGVNNGTGFATERWSANYPPAYSTLVSLFSKSRNFPMGLTWAIMREESRFRPSVVSPAQAIGLMQIIPPTGEEIAQDLERPGFVPEWLYQPVTNIEFGVHYLNKN
ncbi:MAG: tetratricopeptide repeat protein, partial [bacterium]|nr:tetratricopeptide repeat protein [bacterium]